jgi:tetratricopeptide (TPR) repeat protein
LGDTEAAIVALTQAANASEPLISAMALYRLGQLELGVGNADAAVEYFDRLLQLDGGFFPPEEALMAKARAQRDAGDPRAALATYQRVLQDYAGSYSEIEARTHVEEISAQLGLDPNVQSD